jgi:hypothetical protein
MAPLMVPPETARLQAFRAHGSLQRLRLGTINAVCA